MMDREELFDPLGRAMTGETDRNCYLCHHPILEGQNFKQHPQHRVIPADGRVAHENPADHLPTLEPDEKFGELVEHITKKRDERAARMVEEERAENYREYIDLRLKALAARIRSGE